MTERSRDENHMLYRPKCERVELEPHHLLISLPPYPRVSSPDPTAIADTPNQFEQFSTSQQKNREEWSLWSRDVHGKPLVYLDNAATSQKPNFVLKSINDYYTTSNANVHRGVHALSDDATARFELARKQIASFINARSDREIVFTKNATEGINLVAYGWALHHLKMGDEILVSVAEHHSNLVPWHIICRKTGAELKVMSLSQDTETLNLDDMESMLTDSTKLVSTFHVSNVLSAKSPIGAIAEKAHKCGAKLLVDCCQSLPHIPMNVQKFGADWIVGSGHKMCGPTGIGFLWGKYDNLLEMEPVMGGGEMIQDVFLDHFTHADPPSRFEAGTPPIAQAVGCRNVRCDGFLLTMVPVGSGLGAACAYLSEIGMENIYAYETEIGNYLYEKLSEIDGVRIYGPPISHGHGALCAFNVDGIHGTDLAVILDQQGVAIRSGHHCAQPLHRYFGVSSSARASLYFYNTQSEIDFFIEALKEGIAFFK